MRRIFIVSLLGFIFTLQAQAFRWASDAQWIGSSDDDQCLYSPYLAVFRLSMQFRLGVHTDEASIVWGADDERLLSADMNPFEVSHEKGQTWVKLVYRQIGDSATVNVYRKGYAPADDDAHPLVVFPVPRQLPSVASGFHHIVIASCLGDSKIYVDSVSVGTINLNPLGRGGDFIALPVLGKVGFAVGEGKKAEVREFAVGNYRSPYGRIARIKELEGTYDGLTRIIDPSRHSMPLLRGYFNARGAVKKAELRITARGIYGVKLNGKNVNISYLCPGYTQYNRTQPYQSYDVTDDLRQGINLLDVQLAEGWWMGAATYEGQNWNYFGDRMSMKCQLDILYDDGHKQTFASDPQDWKYTSQSPVVYGSLFQGEVYDARKENGEEGWKPCEVIGIKGHVSHEGWGNGPAPDDYSQLQYMETSSDDSVDSIATLTATNMTEPRRGVYVYDMGQNMVGVPRLCFHNLKPGQRVKVRYAEVLYPNLPEYHGKQGMLMLENIRAAMAQDIYIARGGKEETFAPRYTTHGFRYMEITGVDTPLAIEEVQGIVLSSAHSMQAHYECSDSFVNRLWRNILWSTRGNLLSIPTDCPQRNERLGWAGDLSVFSPTLVYLTNVRALLRRYLQSMRDVQHDDGRMPDIAPLGGGFGGFLWGSASITVPWEMYQQWADTLTLRQHYPAMHKYMEYVRTHYFDAKTGLLVQEHAWGDLSDWLSPVYAQDDKSLIWEAYYIHCLDIMAQAARVLNYTFDAATYGKTAGERRRFFCETYLDKATGRTIASAFMGEKRGSLVDTEVSYALPLAFDIVPLSLRSRLADNLLSVMNRENRMDNGRSAPPHSLLTGFIGTSWISRALSLSGHTDEAYRLLTQRQYPSWLYPVTQGATTIWERLNSYTSEDGFGGNNRMNSFNHYSFGAVGYWLMAHSLGIQRSPHHPGFEHVIWAPEADPTGKLTYAKGWYDTAYGRIESSWEIKGNKVLYRLTIPQGVSATMHLPGATSKILKAGSYSFSFYWKKQ